MIEFTTLISTNTHTRSNIIFEMPPRRSRNSGGGSRACSVAMPGMWWDDEAEVLTAYMNGKRFTTSTKLLHNEDIDPKSYSTVEKNKVQTLKASIVGAYLLQNALENEMTHAQRNFRSGTTRPFHIGKSSRLMPEEGHWVEFKAAGADGPVVFRLLSAEIVMRARAPRPSELVTLMDMFQDLKSRPLSLDQLWELPWKVVYDRDALPQGTLNSKPHDVRFTLRSHYCLRGHRVAPDGSSLTPVCYHFEVESPDDARRSLPQYTDSRKATTFLFVCPLLDESFLTTELEAEGERQIAPVRARKEVLEEEMVVMKARINNLERSCAHLVKKIEEEKEEKEKAKEKVKTFIGENEKLIEFTTPVINRNTKYVVELTNMRTLLEEEKEKTETVQAAHDMLSSHHNTLLAEAQGVQPEWLTNVVKEYERAGKLDQLRASLSESTLTLINVRQKKEKEDLVRGRKRKIDEVTKKLEEEEFVRDQKRVALLAQLAALDQETAKWTVKKSEKLDEVSAGHEDEDIALKTTQEEERKKIQDLAGGPQPAPQAEPGPQPGSALRPEPAPHPALPPPTDRAHTLARIPAPTVSASSAAP